MWILVAILTALGGTALHFLYDVLPGPLTALVSPINESVWEHLKLLYWPMLLGASVLVGHSREKQRLWSSFFVAVLFTPAFLLLCFYGLKALGLESTALDIALYYISMFAGYGLAWLLYQYRRLETYGGYWLMFVILYGACLILFTFATPDLPIFKPIPS